MLLMFTDRSMMEAMQLPKTGYATADVDDDQRAVLDFDFATDETVHFPIDQPYPVEGVTVTLAWVPGQGLKGLHTDAAYVAAVMTGVVVWEVSADVQDGPVLRSTVIAHDRRVDVRLGTAAFLVGRSWRLTIVRRAVRPEDTLIADAVLRGIECRSAQVQTDAP